MSQSDARFPQYFGRFELVERLGLGGMATVDRALQWDCHDFARQVVLKRILPHLADQAPFVRMFIDEAKFGARLNHPNIVQIYDLGVHDGCYYMTMEHVDGVSLLDLITKRGDDSVLPPEVAADIVAQICSALHYAHTLARGGRSMGIIHRDVTPENVMISRDGVVKLLDFGVAKPATPADREHTRVGTLKGKLSYMSPEQVECKPLDARSDIFITGILLWELLTGRRLFKDKTEYLTLRNVLRAAVPSPRSIRPEIPHALDRICLRALERDPARRFSTAEEMGDLLESEVVACSQTGPSRLSALVAPLIGGDAQRPARDASGRSAAASPERPKPLTTKSTRRTTAALVGVALGSTVLLGIAITLLSL